MEREMINALGFVHDESYADGLRDIFNKSQVAMAGGKPDNTRERARVVPVHFRNSIKGWLVKVDERPIEEIGKPWPT